MRKMKKKKKRSIFLQCLTLQPQCKHSITLFFGFVTLRFGQKETEEEEKRSSFVSHTRFHSLQAPYCVFILNYPLPAAHLLGVKADATLQPGRSTRSRLSVDTLQPTSCREKMLRMSLRILHCKEFDVKSYFEWLSCFFYTQKKWMELPVSCI